MFEGLDNSKIKSIHLKITALSSAGFFLDGYDIAIVSVAILLLNKEFNLNSLDQTLLLGSTLIGMVMGGILGGVITDRKGRKYIFMWDMILFAVFTFLTAISTSLDQLLIFRLLLGISIGADYAISPTIISEYSPTSQRGKLLTLTGISWFVGAAVSYLAGFIFAPLGSLGWRLMFLSGIIPAVIVLVLRSSIPESPRWLAMEGKLKEAGNSISSVTGENESVATADSRKVPLRELFGKKYRASLAFVLSFWFILDAVTYAIALYGPTFIQKTFNLLTGQASLIAGIIAIVSILGAILGFFLIDTSGRRKVTIYGFLGMAITLAAGSISLILGWGLIPLILLIILFEISEEFGPGITNSIYPQELFPTGVRATAQGLGTTVSRIGALVGIFAFSFASVSFGFPMVMLMLAIISIAGLLITIAYGPETMRKSLEESSHEINDAEGSPTEESEYSQEAEKEAI